MTTIPLPSMRIGTRIVLPAAIVLSALSILAWSSWRAWAPLTIVRATPVVVRAISSNTISNSSAQQLQQTDEQNTAALHSQKNSMPNTSSTTMRGAIVQAPGWVEPSPFPIAASALTSGVVREVLVLEGDRVAKDQVVARLIDDQSKLALRRAQAEVRMKESDAAMLEDELQRKQKLIAGGGVSEGEVARLAIKFAGAKASLDQTMAARDEAALLLQRMEVRSPVNGVVMVRLAAPGSLVGMDAQSAVVAQLFDPLSLQVRTDVPLADAGKLRVGQMAQVQFDSLPGQLVTGRVIRLVQQADIAKNTLQAKVLLDNPPAGLVPDMLARVKIYLDPAPSTKDSSASTSRTEIIVPESVLANLNASEDGTRTGMIRVLIDIRDGVGRVQERQVTSAAPSQQWTVVLDGLRPGDWVVLADSPTTRNGQSVRMDLSDSLPTQDLPQTQMVDHEHH